MLLIYIAGPFRGPDAWSIAQNVRRAEELGLEVARHGFFPVIPHANTALFHGIKLGLPDYHDDDFWLVGTLELLSRCDGLITLPNWQRSMGACSEVEYARSHDIPVFHDLAELVRNGRPTFWVNGKQP